MLIINPAIPIAREVTDARCIGRSGSFALGKSGEPLLDGFRAIYGGSAAKILAFVAVIGLIASFHTIIYAKGRQIYLAVAGRLFPDGSCR